MARLEDRRRFLEQSLADAFAEYQAGDLSEGDYQALRHRDTARLAIVDQLMDASANSERVSAPRPLAATLPDPVRTSPGPKRSRRQRILLSGGIAALTVALVLVVSLSASQRLPGQAVSGSILLSRQGQIQRSLAQAATLENQGHTAEAVRLYETVLGRQPGNEVAMAQLGWIEYETGVRGGSTSLIAKGRATLVEAVHLAPGDYAARLYLGTVLYQQDGNAAGAVTQYKKFLADHPPATVVTQAASILRSAYAKAGVPLPAQVP